MCVYIIIVPALMTSLKIVCIVSYKEMLYSTTFTNWLKAISFMFTSHQGAYGSRYMQTISLLFLGTIGDVIWIIYNLLFSEIKDALVVLMQNNWCLLLTKVPIERNLALSFLLLHTIDDKIGNFWLTNLLKRQEVAFTI